jgi:RecA-family ATPase
MQTTTSKYSIDQLEIKPSDRIQQDQCILFFKSNGSQGWAEMLTAGNISTIIGKAKSRKTFFITLLTAAILGNNIPGMRSEFDGKVVIFDTEQSKYYVWKLAKRIETMIGDYSKKLRIFGLRPLATKDRISEIEKYIYIHTPKLVIIDGIRDLVSDINNADEATDVIGQLMKWSYDLDCHICCVLHQNKADENARGHIGTEIVNKSETVLSVQKLKNTQFSSAKGAFTRGIEPAEIQFTVEHNIPIVIEDSTQTAYHESEDKPF